MTEQQAYPIPPITEAVIEIRFAEKRTEQELLRAASKLMKVYGNRENTEHRDYQIDLGVGEIKTVVEPIIRLNNDDQDKIALIASDKIIVSQLAVYNGWDNFRQRFVNDWNACKSVFGYRKISRVGVRYINRIDVPPQDGVCHYEDYLDLHIKLPELLDPSLNFNLRIEKAFSDPECVVLVTSNPTPSPLPNCGAFLLDIDVGCVQQLPQRDEELFLLLDRVRNLKNKVFEACITDLSRERLRDGLWLK